MLLPNKIIEAHLRLLIDIGKLIAAKRAAGRPKDLIALPELEAIQEAQATRNTEDTE